VNPSYCVHLITYCLFYFYFYLITVPFGSMLMLRIRLLRLLCANKNVTDIYLQADAQDSNVKPLAAVDK